MTMRLFSTDYTIQADFERDHKQCAETNFT